MRTLRAPALLLAIAALPALSQVPFLDEILSHHLEALGGAAKVHAVQGLRITGTFTLAPGNDNAIFFEERRDGACRRDMALESGHFIELFDGQQAWQKVPDSASFAPVTGAALARYQHADFDGVLVDSKAKGAKVEYLERIKVEGKETYKLRSTDKWGKLQYHYLDCATLLEVQEETPNADGTVDLMSMQEYRLYQGMAFPLRVVFKRKYAKEEQVLTVTNIELNPPLEDARFRPPVAK